MVVTLRIPPIVLLVVPTILTGSFVAGTKCHPTMSMARLERMVRQERMMLEELRDYFNYMDIGKKPIIKKFLKHQMALAVEREMSEYDEFYFKHPNSIFQIIKDFRRDYSSANTSLGKYYEDFIKFIEESDNCMSGDFDIASTSRVLLVLQHIYELPAETMMNGDYLGFKGPPLEPSDVIDIGRHALEHGFLNASLEWLNLGLALKEQNKSQLQQSEGHIKALMGLVFLENNDITKAMDLYNEALNLDPRDQEVAVLGGNIQKGITTNTTYLKNFTEELETIKPLCALGPGLHTGDPKSPKIFCRYREALLPYYRYKEEILSLVPLVSVVYNFTTDGEAQALKEFVKDTLKPASIGHGQVTLTRTAVVGFLKEEDESKVNVHLVKRLELLTGLEAKKVSPSHSPTEATQVINYGFGGHYLPHIDAPKPFEKPVKKGYYPGSTRVFTCLIYLSNVEKGGATVFPKLNISVFPIKHMALMWYNLNPAGEIENDSLHAGCPVAVGHKWIANKWIWTPGSLHRRCGLSVYATNHQMELKMKRRYRRKNGRHNSRKTGRHNALG